MVEVVDLVAVVLERAFRGSFRTEPPRTARFRRAGERRCRRASAVWRGADRACERRVGLSHRDECRLHEPRPPLLRLIRAHVPGAGVGVADAEALAGKVTGDDEVDLAGGLAMLSEHRSPKGEILTQHGGNLRRASGGTLGLGPVVEFVPAENLGDAGAVFVCEG